MKNTPFWALIGLALHAPLALAQSTGTITPPSCSASLIASLCEYPAPGPEFAVAIDSKDSCLQYCNDHTPCAFVIFAATGNPSLGTGTCWLYPGQTFDASKGSSTGCGSPYLSVYSQPKCSVGTATSPSCAATATPSAVASVCGYPEPETCFSTCYASSGATNCLSLCADAASCSYAVFNPHNPSNSQYASGTCWVYPNGTYNAASTTTCSGAPQQYVYDNLCPKPSSSASSSSSISPTAMAVTNGTAMTAGANSSSTTTNKSMAPVSLSVSIPLGMAMAALLVVVHWRSNGF